MCVVNYLLMVVRHCGFFHSLDICKRPERRKYQYQSTKSSIKCACSLHWLSFFFFFFVCVCFQFENILRQFIEFAICSTWNFRLCFFKGRMFGGYDAEVENDMHSEYQLISSSLSYILWLESCAQFAIDSEIIISGLSMEFFSCCCCCCFFVHFMCRYWIKFNAHLHFLVIFEFIKTKQWAGCCFFSLQKKNKIIEHYILFLNDGKRNGERVKNKNKIAARSNIGLNGEREKNISIFACFNICRLNNIFCIIGCLYTFIDNFLAVALYFSITNIFFYFE